MIKYIFLDLDDTIFDFHKAEKVAIAKTLQDMGIEVNEKIMDRYRVINDAQWKMLENGELTREELKIRRYRLLFEELQMNCSAKEAAVIYEKYLSQGHFFIDGAEAMLYELKDRYRLFLVSNGTAVVQKGRLASSGIEPFFERIFISEEVGFNKPAKEYFEYCFSQIPEFKREESVIVGDSLTSDIRGGKNAEIKTIWFQPKLKANESATGAIQPDYTIHKLSELGALLEKL